jgi:hypothetical protein
VATEYSACGPAMTGDALRARFIAAIGVGLCELISLCQEELLDICLSFDTFKHVRERV